MLLIRWRELLGMRSGRSEDSPASPACAQNVFSVAPEGQNL